MSLPHRLAVGGGRFDALHGLGHARVGLGAFSGDLARPLGETIRVRRGGAPLGADLAAQRPGTLGRCVLLSTRLALAEPAHSSEATTGGGLVCDGIEVGGTISLGPHRQRPDDPGTYLLGGVLGTSERRLALVVLRSMGGALGVEP